MLRTSYFILIVNTLLIFFNMDKLNSQSMRDLVFFPASTKIPVFPADPMAHRMKIGNIPGSKDMRASLGGIIPVVETQDRKLRLSTAASVQFGIHPSGQAEIVSLEFYLDYIILDYALAQFVYLRTLLGHTSHHLSDTEFEKRQLGQTVNYSRDYTAIYGIYSNDRTLLYGGANFGYVFHLEGKESKTLAVSLWSGAITIEMECFSFLFGRRLPLVSGSRFPIRQYLPIWNTPAR